MKIKAHVRLKATTPKQLIIYTTVMKRIHDALSEAAKKAASLLTVSDPKLKSSASKVKSMLEETKSFIAQI